MQNRLLTLFALALSLTVAAAAQNRASNSVPATSGIGAARPDSHFLQIERFVAFSQLIANEEGNYNRDSQAGNPTDKDMVNYSKFLHITASEEQLMRIILVDAFDHVEEARKQWLDAGAGAHLSPAERASDVNARNLDRTKTYEGAISQLKQQLGEDDFKKLDDELYRMFTRPFLAGRHRVSTPSAPVAK